MKKARLISRAFLWGEVDRFVGWVGPRLVIAAKANTVQLA